MPWKDFEKEASNFLKSKIKGKNIYIESLGGSDSTEKDIKIFKDNKLHTIIEVKEENAQMGQLVVILNQDKSKFVLSKKSIDFEEKLKISSDILKYINNNFEFIGCIIQQKQRKQKPLHYYLQNKFSGNFEFNLKGREKPKQK